MEIQIEQLMSGAKKAKGLTVIIDVFRAFSLECYAYASGAKEVYPVGSLEEAFLLKKQDPTYLLVGERDGIKVEGFDYGNSPSSLITADLKDRSIIHSTSSGVQGILAATSADEIITGALVNAKAISRYIQWKKPKIVTLVAMGWKGEYETPEDTLCAEYIASLVKGEEMVDLKEKIEALKESEGKKFFDPKLQHIFPEKDFYLCTECNCFDFVLSIQKKNDQFYSKRIDI